MPLPLLVPIAVAAAGAWGAGKATKAAWDSSEASDINSASKRLVVKSDEQLELSREATNSGLETLGKKKLECSEKDLERFVQVYRQIGNIEIEEVELLSGNSVSSDCQSPDSIVEDCAFLVESSAGVLKGAASGALTAYGAYSGTALLAASGTGTAISSLGGVAATNATLAWLGGGTLASGGLGVAGGAMVLGTLAAGPALLIFGSVLGAQASKRLNDAKSNLELAEAYQKQTEMVCTKLDGITDLTRIMSNTLSKLRGRLRRSVTAMEGMISEAGQDYLKFSSDQKDLVLAAIAYAGLVKALINTPILDEEGSIIVSSAEKINSIKQELDS